jgi:hypothetical protein
MELSEMTRTEKSNLLAGLTVLALIGAVVALIIDTNTAICAAYLPFIALFVYGASLCKRS